MPLFPTGFLAATSAVEDVLRIESISCDTEVRQKKGADNDEEIRVIVKLTISTIREDVNGIFQGSPVLTESNFNGVVRGGTIFNVQFDLAYFANTSWRLMHDELAGINEEGSKQARQTQSWVGVTAWTDSPWNEA